PEGRRFKSGSRNHIRQNKPRLSQDSAGLFVVGCFSWTTVYLGFSRRLPIPVNELSLTLPAIGRGNIWILFHRDFHLAAPRSSLALPARGYP
ncbi:hypothetical protein, partial [Pseudomonas sp.]|uniref:hypothetical protein n=1 Tax=Pseudomonas sp. TaxID=306 RepID=UPI0028A791E5